VQEEAAAVAYVLLLENGRFCLGVLVECVPADSIRHPKAMRRL
jgi:hypothetical protein